MKKLMLTVTLAAIAFSAVAPVQAMTSTKGLFDASVLDGQVDKRRHQMPL
jgi:hypothetical protein